MYESFLTFPAILGATQSFTVTFQAGALGDGLEGRDRDRIEDNKDWYWGISYIEKVRGKWCDRSAPLSRSSLPLAR